jgi:hypothetical protein
VGNILKGRGYTFPILPTKNLGDGGRSEEKRHCAVNSKKKLNKNSFLVVSFLTCWLAGPFCRNHLFINQWFGG